MKNILLLLALLLISHSVLANKNEQQPSGQHSVQAKTRAKLTEFQLYTQDGKLISSSDFKGEPLILHFWGTWCPYCKILHPGLEKLRSNFENKGLNILAVSINEQENAKPQDALHERGVYIKTVLNGEVLALEQLKIIGTPSTFFIAPNGDILGSTMDSNPDNPKFTQIAQYLVNLPRP